MLSLGIKYSTRDSARVYELFGYCLFNKEATYFIN